MRELPMQLVGVIRIKGVQQLLWLLARVHKVPQKVAVGGLYLNMHQQVNIVFRFILQALQKMIFESQGNMCTKGTNLTVTAHTQDNHDDEGRDPNTNSSTHIVRGLIDHTDF